MQIARFVDCAYPKPVDLDVQVAGNTATIRLHHTLVGTWNGEGAAHIAMNNFCGSTLVTTTGTRDDLVAGRPITITAQPSWKWVMIDRLPYEVTTLHLAHSTGFQSDSVRTQLSRWRRARNLQPVGWGPNGARTYSITHIQDAVLKLPGRGNWGARK